MVLSPTPFRDRVRGWGGVDKFMLVCDVAGYIPRARVVEAFRPGPDAVMIQGGVVLAQTNLSPTPHPRKHNCGLNLNMATLGTFRKWEE